MNVTIKQIDVKNGIGDWLETPSIVNKGDPHFRRQIDLMEKMRIDPKHAPFFQFGEAAFFVAYRGGKPVGRISAQVNRRHLERYNDATGHFGFFDCSDDQEAAGALVAKAAEWLRAKGMTRMLGPVSFSLNEESGLLVKGFDSPPALLMPHGPAFAGALLEKAGLVKEMDLFVYRTSGAPVPRIEKLAARASRMSGIALREFDMRRWTAEVELLVDIFNDAWSGNWGFVPFARAEIDAMARELKPFFRNGYGRFFLIDGVEAGVIVLLPDVNGVIKDFNGKLLPFNWAKLIWRMKRETWTSARVPLMGIRRQFHATPQAGGILALMAKSMMDHFRTGYRIDWAEYSWVLEVNKPMTTFGEVLAGPPVKTLRLYARPI